VKIQQIESNGLKETSRYATFRHCMFYLTLNERDGPATRGPAFFLLINCKSSGNEMAFSRVRRTVLGEKQKEQNEPTDSLTLNALRHLGKVVSGGEHPIFGHLRRPIVSTIGERIGRRLIQRLPGSGAVCSRRSRRHIGSPQRQLWVNRPRVPKPANAGDINAQVMSPAFAGSRLLLFNPQLALWATDMPPASPAAT
jgi:hypothetical protein